MAYSERIMFGLGVGELLVILVIVLLFGASRLPEIGEGFGKGIRNFRKALKMPDEIDVTPPERKPDSPTKEKS